MFRVIRNFELNDVFELGNENWESLGELYELCDNLSRTGSSYAEFTVFNS